jgi:homocysteine S-methyltransferase
MTDAMPTTLVDALDSGPVVLDGGLATQLEAQGNDLTSSLWSARLLLDRPNEIVSAHRRFFEAGAAVAITASYQASFDGFAALGVDHASTEALLRRSVELAVTARDGCTDDVPRWVAASVGPDGAARADGSEYRGDYDLGVEELRRWHRPRLAVLADAGADLLAMETVPCLAEAEALLAEIDGTGVACWLSLTCDGTRTRAGEPVEQAFAMARDVAEVVAVGVNCTHPDQVASLVALAAAASGKPVVVYPNSGEGWDARARSWTGSPAFTTAQVGAWVSAGARLVGGCCRVGPDQIRSIQTMLTART